MPSLPMETFAARLNLISEINFSDRATENLTEGLFLACAGRHMAVESKVTNETEAEHYYSSSISSVTRLVTLVDSQWEKPVRKKYYQT